MMGRNLIEGVFDLLHFGHINIIYNAKVVSGTLCLAVNDDDSTALAKGFKPIYSSEERMKLCESIRFVDESVGSISYIFTMEKFETFKCFGLCHGSDVVPGNFLYGQLNDVGRLIILPRTLGISSSALIARLLKASVIVHNEDAGAEGLWTEHMSECSDPGWVSKLLDYSERMDSDLRDVLEKFVSHYNESSAIDDLGRLDGLPQQSVIPFKRLRELSSKRIQTAEDVVVYVDGSFDLIHAGHVDMLAEARKLGTWIVVGLFDDTTIRKIRGSAFPIISLMERAAVLLSMRDVDEVYFGTEWHLSEMFLDIIKPKVIIMREELRTANHMFAIRTRSAFSNDPYTEAKKMGIRIVEPHMSLTISDIYERVYHRRNELIPFIEKRLRKEIENFSFVVSETSDAPS